MNLPNTKRLTFRHFCKNDIQLIIDLDSDPDVMKYITLGIPRNPDEIQQKYFPRIINSYQSGTYYGIHAAFLINNPTFIGWFQFEPDKQIENAIEIGWRLSKNYWNNGYGTEGAKNLIQIGKSLNKKLVAKAMIENKASISIMEKCGLKFVKEYWGDYKPHSNSPDVLYELNP